MEISFIVNGEIVPQARPRLSTASGWARAYDPEKSRNFKGKVKHKAWLAMEGRKPFRGPVQVEITVYRQVPSSWSRKKAQRAIGGFIAPMGRPDVDNLAKGIMDGMTGVTWRDDSQVVRLSVAKRYDKIEWASVRVLALLEEQEE